MGQKCLRFTVHKKNAFGFGEWCSARGALMRSVCSEGNRRRGAHAPYSKRGGGGGDD